MAKNIWNVGNHCPCLLFVLFDYDTFQENLFFLWGSCHESTSQLGWNILTGKREYCLRVSNSCVTFSKELTSLSLSFLIFRGIKPVPSSRAVVKWVNLSPIKWVNLSPSAKNSSQLIKVFNKDQKLLISAPLYLHLHKDSTIHSVAQARNLCCSFFHTFCLSSFLQSPFLPSLLFPPRHHLPSEYIKVHPPLISLRLLPSWKPSSTTCLDDCGDVLPDLSLANFPVAVRTAERDPFKLWVGSQHTLAQNPLLTPCYAPKDKSPPRSHHLPCQAPHSVPLALPQTCLVCFSFGAFREEHVWAAFALFWECLLPVVCKHAHLWGLP